MQRYIIYIYIYIYIYILYYRGKKFRIDLKDFFIIKSILPICFNSGFDSNCFTTNDDLMITSSKTVCVYLNRCNIYLETKVRLSNHFGIDSYRAILEPIAQDLAILRDKFPMTIIYLKLKYCGYAYSLFERLLSTSQYAGDPAGKLFAQFHPPQTDRLKKRTYNGDQERKLNNKSIPHEL